MEKFELQYPLNTIWITQEFGANSGLIQSNGKSYYQNNGMLGHNGIDYFAPDGRNVFASHEGTCYLEVDSSGGNGVTIISDKSYDYKGNPTQFKSIYWHLKEHNNKVITGQKVKAGDIIGLADNTGFSTGSHLHFGLKPIIANINIEQNNGYSGAIDPTPYFNGKYPPFIYTNTKLLKYGMWSIEVIYLQQKLQSLGFYTASCDGSFGKRTLQAVKDFQKSKGLVVDGIVGKLTNLELKKGIN